MTQPDLFGAVEPPRAFARRADPSTSHEAASSIEPKLSDLEALVLGCLKRAGKNGRTVDELTAALKLDKVTISPRLKPLCEKGLARDSGKTRKGASGRSQTVWLAT